MQVNKLGESMNAGEQVNWPVNNRQWGRQFLLVLILLMLKLYYCSTEKTVLVSTGFHGDVLALTKLLEVRLKVICVLFVLFPVV